MTAIGLRQQREEEQAEAALAAATAQLDGEKRLEESAFRHFQPLLAACQDYANLSGCRFRSASFEGLEGALPANEGAAARHVAKRRAASAVTEFSARLLEGEQGLVEEVDRAFRIVMQESVRNAMMGLFQTLEMFPPSPPPQAVDEADCAFEDVTAPLEVVAQRLYNDEARRVGDELGLPGYIQRRATTAAFLIDFAENSGHRLPPIPETQTSMLKEISARVQEELRQRGEPTQRQELARSSFLGGLGNGAAAETLRGETEKFWAENWRTIAVGAAGIVAVGLAAVLSGAMAGSSRRRNRASEL